MKPTTWTTRDGKRWLIRGMATDHLGRAIVNWHKSGRAGWTRMPGPERGYTPEDTMKALCEELLTRPDARQYPRSVALVYAGTCCRCGKAAAYKVGQHAYCLAHKAEANNRALVYGTALAKRNSEYGKVADDYERELQQRDKLRKWSLKVKRRK